MTPESMVLFERVLGRRTLTVYPLTFGRARLGIGPTGTGFFDDEF